MIRVAFIKYGGMGAGGTERWLQMAALALPREKYHVTYFYSDNDIDPNRLRLMQSSALQLVQFSVKSRKKNLTHDWESTDFWEKFHESEFDLVQTAKFCTAEYPYNRINLPIVEKIAFAVGVDYSPNIIFTITPSDWLRRKWVNKGGTFIRSGVVPVPVQEPCTTQNFRTELGIPNKAIVAGFHQRIDDNSFSPIPLQAFARLQKIGRHFVILGGSKLYYKQAQALGLRNIHFIEHNSDPYLISKFLNTLDIFAHGRKDGETYGSVFSEALMHGLPCLSHRSSADNAQKETMGPHGLFAWGLITYWIHLFRLFKCENLRNNLSAGSRDYAKKRYGASEFQVKLTNIYEKISELI